MATKAQQKENLEKVTDYVEERVLDADRMAKAMSSLESDKSGARAEAAKQILYVRVCLSLSLCDNCVHVFSHAVLAPAPFPCKHTPRSFVCAFPSHPTVIEGHSVFTHSAPTFCPSSRPPSSTTT
jgi:hypothetical protein